MVTAKLAGAIPRTIAVRALVAAATPSGASTACTMATSRVRAAAAPSRGGPSALVTQAVRRTSTSKTSSSATSSTSVPSS